jgi:two-component system, sensor histidine kinase and response regulator
MNAEDIMNALQTHFAGTPVLVVDDEPINQEIMRYLLVQTGLEVDVAADGMEAFERVKAKSYALIFMDVNMPVMGGLEAASRMRDLPGYAHTPIIAVTADTSDEEQAACLKAGMTDHLGKPTGQDRLYRVTLRWLSGAKN